MNIRPKLVNPSWVVQYKKPKQFEGIVRPDNFYHSTAWRKVRALFINEHPLCYNCEKKGIIKIAKVVDHIKPILKGGEALSFSNLQSLCHKCHNVKSAKQRHEK